MEISWLGHACFRIRAKEATVVTDPYDRSLGSLNKITADIVTVSNPDAAYSNVGAIGGTAKVLEGPGEYEVSGIFVTGVRTYRDKTKGKDHGKNTAYLIGAEDLIVCHLGALGHVPTAEQIEQMSKIDVLIVPVGEGSPLDPTAVAETVQRLEPKIIVPMNFKGAGQNPDALQKYLSEIGGPAAVPQNRLVVTRATLPLTVQVALLESRG
ncbi:MAG: MBL fold metallo-hydrolase [Chloroflexi bacterium]|nr:MBL fold metallo-hydrolase [Chloroflexota bacterium]